MFSSIEDTNGPGFVMPHGPFGSGNEQFLEFSPESSRFRLQRLGIYLASNLFTPGYMDGATFVRDKVLTTLARGKTLHYTGDVLDQWDLDVLIHCATYTSLSPNRSSQLQIDPVSVLRTHGLRNDSRNRERVFESLSRLHTGNIEIVGGQYRYMTRLINRLLLDWDRQFALVEVNVDVAASLRHSDQTGAAIRDRVGLGRNGMAKWVHGMLMVFKGGFVAEIDALRRLSGAAAKNDRIFISAMAKSLQVLKTAGCITDWRLEGSRIRVVAQPAHTYHTACGYIDQAVHS